MRRRGERVLGPYPDRRSWRLLLVAADGTRRMELLATRERAEARRRELEAALVVVAATLDEAIDAYERHLTAKGNRPRSVLETARRLRRFWGDLDVALEDLSPSRARARYEAMVAAGLAADSHRNYLAEAKTFCRWLVAQRWIGRSPLEAVAGVGRRRHGKPQLRLDEARAWRAHAHELAAAGDEGAVAALLALLCGLRAGEIVGLRVRDLDDGGRLLWVASAKTAAGVRQVAVPEELRGYLAERAGGRDGAASIWSGRHWRDWPREAAQRISRGAGVPATTAHGLRGLAATLAGAAAVLAGSGLGGVAQALGHVDVRTTTTSYVDAAELERARRRQALTVLDGGGADRSATVPQTDRTARNVL